MPPRGSLSCSPGHTGHDSSPGIHQLRDTRWTSVHRNACGSRGDASDGRGHTGRLERRLTRMAPSAVAVRRLLGHAKVEGIGLIEGDGAAAPKLQAWATGTAKHSWPQRSRSWQHGSTKTASRRPVQQGGRRTAWIHGRPVNVAWIIGSCFRDSGQRWPQH